jgi:hypothetical protein
MIANRTPASRKDETLGVMAEGFMGNQTADTPYFAAANGIEQAPRSDAKRLSDVTAKLAILGFSLYPLHDETLLLTRWNMSRTLPSIEAAEQFLRQVGVSANG